MDVSTSISLITVMKKEDLDLSFFFRLLPKPVSF